MGRGRDGTFTMKDVGGIRDGTLTVRDNRCGTGVKAEALNVTGVDRRID